jgi:hypothetical protein
MPEAKSGGNIKSTGSRSESVASRPARGKNKPGTNIGGKSKGAADKALRYPLARIDNSTDYLSITVSKFAPNKKLLGNVESIEYLEENGKDAGKIKKDFNFSSTAINSNAKQIGSNIINGLSTASERLRGSSKKDSQYFITLPIPNGINDTNSVSWGEDSLNPLQAAGINAIGAVSGGEGIPSALQGMGSSLLDAAGNSGNQKAIIAAIAGYGVGASPSSLISRATGQILNPNLELLFSGVNLRSFGFTFDFAPRSNPEGEMVKKIINAFKRSMVPASNGGILIQSPSVFQLQYKKGNGPHPFLHSFKPCALVNMGVNYTGSGTYATYRDGTPVHMQLQLQFKELNPIYGEDYDQIDSGVGY